MAIEAEILQDTTTITTKDSLDIQGSDIAVVTDNGIKEVEATSNTFVLSSGGMYTGNMNGNTPKWLNDAITNEIANGTLTLSDAVSQLDTYVRNMKTGINQDIVNLQNNDVTMNALITTNKTQVDNNIAAIGQTLLTKITKTEATAISQNVIGTEFSGKGGTVASSWFTNNIKSYSDATNANTTSLNALASVITDPVTGVTATANDIKTGYTTVGLNPDGTLGANAGSSELMTAVVGPVKVKLTALEGVSAGYFHEWNGTEPVKIGMIHTTTDGIVYQYYGGSWNDGYQIGWKRLDKAANDAARALATNLLTTTNDLQTQIDGAITTWFNDGAPEFVEKDGKYISTNTSANLVTNDLVWDVRSGTGQMYKYTGSNTNGVDLTSITFPTDSNWIAIYKIIADEAQWYTDDNIDVSNGYVWYDSNNYIQPVLDTNKPVTNLIRANHIGDLYYDKLTGFAYRYSYENLPSDTPDRGVYYSWILISDVNITKALADAARAQDTADGKRTVYYLATPPTTGVQVGDMNVDPTTKVVTAWSGSAWVDTTNYGALQAAADAATVKKVVDSNKATQLIINSNLDGKITTEEKNRITAVTNAQQAAIADAASKYYATAIVDGKITTVEQNRINAFNSVTAAYKEYSNIIAKALSDGVLTSAEQATISVAKANVDAAAARLTSITNTANQAHGWAGAASKLITDPNTGAVTGWSFADGTGVQSEFKINSDKFILEDSNNATTPFLEVDNVAHTAQFNGVVQFSKAAGTPTHSSGTTSPTLGATTAVEGSTYYNTSTKRGYIVSGGNWINNSSVTDTSNLALKDMSNVTTIDGGKITTGKIQSVDGQTYFDLANNLFKMVDGIIEAASITGTTLTGANINGSVIRGSYIDMTNTHILTDWQHYTPSTVPSAYIANFAKDNTTGALITDSNGYVRLPALSTVSFGTNSGQIKLYGMGSHGKSGSTPLVYPSTRSRSYSSYTGDYTTGRFRSAIPHLSVSTSIIGIFNYNIADPQGDIKGAGYKDRGINIELRVCDIVYTLTLDIWMGTQGVTETLADGTNNALTATGGVYIGSIFNFSITNDSNTDIATYKIHSSSGVATTTKSSDLSIKGIVGYTEDFISFTVYMPNITVNNNI